MAATRPGPTAEVPCLDETATLTEDIYLLYFDYYLRRCSMANPFFHIELQTQDLEKSETSYAGMFGWKLEELPGMDLINRGV